jgi:conjugative transfer signal peptidase TraF
MAGGCTLIAITALHAIPPLLIWNGSASAPLGLYRRTTQPMTHGEYVLSQLPQTAQRTSDERGYLAAGIPVLKRVAAMAGDRVCRTGLHISINDKSRASAMQADSQGRTMPSWDGCVRLQQHDVFLLLPDTRSFDGRYFGVTSSKLIIGVYRPLWIYGT